MTSVSNSGSRVLIASFLIFCIPVLFFVLSPPPRQFVLWLNEMFLTQNDSYSDFKSENCNGHKCDRTLPLLLLISYDGFRYDYIEKYPEVTPTFRWLIKNGVYAPDGLKNTFITITAPNHYGIVTGLYEENHGIIANTFFNPDLNETFSYFDTRWQTDPRFFRGDPIWNANDRLNPKRATGCVMWVGCDVPINQQDPPIHRISWDENLDWAARVDALISWFKHPDKPINFGILYIEEPDETGHNFGPDSNEIRQTLWKLDQLTAYLLWRLYAVNLLDKMNIIFTADHGMSAVPVLNVINMDKYVNRSLYTVFGGSPNWNIKPKKGKESIVFNALHDKVPHLNVYNKSGLPIEYHYSGSDSVMPIQLEADLHWWIAYNYSFKELGNLKNGSILLERKRRGKNVKLNITSRNFTTGEHGYNNSIAEMHPYFIATGPVFKKSYNVTGQLMNLDLYELMCYILKVDPSPNNGSFERIKNILIDDGIEWKNKQSYMWSFKDDSESKRFDEISFLTVDLNGDVAIMLLICSLFFILMLCAIKSAHPRQHVRCGSQSSLISEKGHHGV